MENENIICGKNAVLEYLLSGNPIDTLYVQKRSDGTSSAGGVGKHIALVKQKGGVIKDCDAVKLNVLTGEARHDGLALVIPGTEYVTADDILRLSAEKNQAPFIIIADEITDPHNLGALIRTAEAAGADGLIIPKRRSAGINSTVHSTSAGAASHLKICREANLSDVISRLKKSGVWIYGAEADGEPYYKQDFTGGTCLVIGSEGNGLRRLVRENCDVVVAVPMYGKINSLNASVCGGILMYEVVRQRQSGVINA
ncbi:MAG: 23S rRNA (guanosine(2251)-2'-O)-methyltransferase RlmB [Oscillospiraceae bacterium]|jgi:23S rRNA (guanosine2251-2'-O)-methyltransferase|nr:23S rRNA (guanosine(2251)-2'-O)-methyltransferase RlmB [Oscillospiraceae bacterium]